MSNSKKGTKNSGTDLDVYIINFTKSRKIPAAHLKNVELVSVLIGGSADLKVGRGILTPKSFSLCVTNLCNRAGVGYAIR